MRDYKHICDNIENVENYEKALADNFEGWHCHHRLETHTSDGERRLVDLTMEELKVLGMYYNRPPEELIFLTAKEHHSLHNKGKQFSEEHKRKCLKFAKVKRMDFIVNIIPKKLRKSCLRHSKENIFQKSTEEK